MTRCSWTGVPSSSYTSMSSSDTTALLVLQSFVLPAHLGGGYRALSDVMIVLTPGCIVERAVFTSTSRTHSIVSKYVLVSMSLTLSHVFLELERKLLQARYIARSRACGTTRTFPGGSLPSSIRWPAHIPCHTRQRIPPTRRSVLPVLTVGACWITSPTTSPC